MTMRLVVVRPQPGLAETLASAEAMDLACLGEPLFEVVPHDWNCPEIADLDGLLIGSANAIRHGGAGLEKLKDLPVYAVGERTAECASDAGFFVAQTGTGDLQNLIDTYLDRPIHLLRLAGKERVDLVAPAQLRMTEREVYQLRALPMPDAMHSALGKESLILVHSAAAARHFTDECERCSIDRSEITLAVLGPRIAAAAGEGWASIYVAKAPNDAALLALAAELCE